MLAGTYGQIFEAKVLTHVFSKICSSFFKYRPMFRILKSLKSGHDPLRNKINRIFQNTKSHYQNVGKSEYVVPTSTVSSLNDLQRQKIPKKPSFLEKYNPTKIWKYMSMTRRSAKLARTVQHSRVEHDDSVRQRTAKYEGYNRGYFAQEIRTLNKFSEQHYNTKLKKIMASLAIDSMSMMLNYIQYDIDKLDSNFKLSRSKIMDVLTDEYITRYTSREYNQYYTTILDIIKKTHKLSPRRLTLLIKAINNAKYKIGCSSSKMLTPMPFQKAHSTASYDSSDHQYIEGYEDIAKFKVEDVDWPEIENYITDRVGPIGKLIEKLTFPSDQIIVSNTSIEAFLAYTNIDFKEISLITLPISSYEKKIWMIRNSKDELTLLFSNIKGQSYLAHYRLLIKRFLYQRNIKTNLSAFISGNDYQKCDKEFNNFLDNNHSKLKNLTSVVFGYARVFQSKWKEHHIETITDEKNDWEINVFDISGIQKVGAICTRTSIHGEILSEFIKATLNKIPSIKHVFFGGSAGFLRITEQYKLFYPTYIESSSGIKVPNALTEEDSYEQTLHQSVISPLMETPDYLAGLHSKNVTSIDMEAGFLADITIKYPDIKIGFGFSPTDFPRHASLPINQSLFKKDVARQQQGIQDLPAVIMNYFKEYNREYNSIFERKYGSLSRLSLSNLGRRIDLLAPLTQMELKLKNKICSVLKLHFSIKVAPEKLREILDHDLFLSDSSYIELLGKKSLFHYPMLEQQLYVASKHLCGEISQNNHADYKQSNKVIIFVKKSCWQSKSWAVKYPKGWDRYGIERNNALTVIPTVSTKGNTNTLSHIEMLFSQLTYVASDYCEVMATEIISHLRRKPCSKLRELLEAPENRFSDLIKQYSFLKLEGKIENSLDVDDIEKVVIPDNISEDLIKLLKSRNIEIEHLNVAARFHNYTDPLSSAKLGPH